MNRVFQVDVAQMEKAHEKRDGKYGAPSLDLPTLWTNTPTISPKGITDPIHVKQFSSLFFRFAKRTVSIIIYLLNSTKVQCCNVAVTHNFSHLCFTCSYSLAFDERILSVCGLLTKGNRNRTTVIRDACVSQTEQICAAAVWL